MTSDSTQLTELLGKTGANDIVRDRIGFVCQRLMELDVDNRCGARHGERTEVHTHSRNGYRDRDWDTRAGTVPLRIPKLRAGSCFPSLPGTPPHRREGLGGGREEAYVQGLSRFWTGAGRDGLSARPGAASPA